jgi:hypothetical protein
MTVLHSQRLRFEPMSEDHFDGLRVLNADPEVMRHISGRPERPRKRMPRSRACRRAGANTATPGGA